MYVASARTFLSHVPLWLEQRPCDMSRVQDIVKQKKDAPIFPGVISVFQYPLDVPTSIAVPQTRAIFDGQHRCLAILAILKVHFKNSICLVFPSDFSCRQAENLPSDYEARQGVDGRRGSFSHQPLEQSNDFDFDIMVEVFAVSQRQQIVVCAYHILSLA